MYGRIYVGDLVKYTFNRTFIVVAENIYIEEHF